MDIERLAQELHEAGRAAYEAGATVAQSMRAEKSFSFIEWDDLTEAAREGRRIQARYLLDKFDISKKV